jgi:hypothetical protein
VALWLATGASGLLIVLGVYAVIPEQARPSAGPRFFERGLVIATGVAGLVYGFSKLLR